MSPKWIKFDEFPVVHPDFKRLWKRSDKGVLSTLLRERKGICQNSWLTSWLNCWWNDSLNTAAMLFYKIIQYMFRSLETYTRALLIMLDQNKDAKNLFSCRYSQRNIKTHYKHTSLESYLPISFQIPPKLSLLSKRPTKSEKSQHKNKIVMVSMGILSSVSFELQLLRGKNCLILSPLQHYDTLLSLEGIIMINIIYVWI